jgi:starch phosphorylase
MQLAGSGASPEAVDSAKHLFDPNALTLGFARRFATYKRPNLLLHDPERLLRLLTNPSARCNSSLPARPILRTRRGRP